MKNSVYRGLHLKKKKILLTVFEIFIWLSHQREKLLSTLMGIELGFACSLSDHTWVCTLFLGYAFFSLVSLSYVILY